MILNLRAELVQLALIALMFIVAAVIWSYVPDRIPVHWNIRGEVDGYGGRFVGLLLLPLTTLGLYALLLLLPRLDPGYANYRAFAGAYNLIRISLVVFMAALYGVTVLAALGQPVDVGTVVTLGVGGLLVVLGNVMGKIRPNWFVGVRTPWTLSSKLSWNKTHRLAGWMFIVMGVLIALTGMLRSDWFLFVTLGISAAGGLWLVVYSYLVYRGDPAPVPPSGTSPG
ncbi:MAG: SdpI family protein [Pirellulales bacterium]